MIPPRSYENAHFLVYSNNAEPFSTNADAYCESALNVGFASATHYTEAMLRQTPFWAENEEILTQERGAGYWLWKPYILLEKLRSVGPNDIVIYNDAGRYKPGSFAPFPRFPHAAAELTARSPKRFMHGFITDWLVTGHYTKRDCLILLDADNDTIRRSAQVSACPLLYMPSPESFAFLERWLELARDPRILTDLPDTLGEPLDVFRDHRHDMAISSILAHQTGAAYFDLSKEGGYLPAEDVRRRNRHVPRTQTHIGYLSLMVERALSDDYFVRDDATLDEARVIARNLTPDQSVPVHPDAVPVSTLRTEITEMLRAGSATLSRDHIRAALSDNRIVATKLHSLTKMQDTSDFWHVVVDEVGRVAPDMGPDTTEADVANVCLDALRVAEQRHPELHRDMMSGYVWTCLDDDTRSLFKGKFKNVKSRQGKEGLESFLAAHGYDVLLPPDLERKGAHVAVAKDISAAMSTWLVTPKGPSA